MTRRVLVTRPQPGADETAARLESMGFSPVTMPLTRIEPVVPAPPPDPDPVDALIVTSVNAIRHAPPDLLARLAAKPVFTVGDASAAAARDAGFVDVTSAEGTARDLARLIARETPAGARLLHLAGRERTAGFAEAVHAAGRSLDVAEVYRAAEIAYPDHFVAGLASQGPLWGALALSPRAAMLLARLVLRPEAVQAFEKTSFFCISENAASVLRPFAGRRISVSREPTEGSVLALLAALA